MQHQWLAASVACCICECCISGVQHLCVLHQWRAAPVSAASVACSTCECCISGVQLSSPQLQFVIIRLLKIFSGFMEREGYESLSLLGVLNQCLCSPGFFKSLKLNHYFIYHLT
jgi:hypothetical protein